jgi:hypothetical protein
VTAITIIGIAKEDKCLKKNKFNNSILSSILFC